MTPAPNSKPAPQHDQFPEMTAKDYVVARYPDARCEKYGEKFVVKIARWTNHVTAEDLSEDECWYKAFRKIHEAEAAGATL